jgi:transcriptional regulator with XRE-family HTH domain/DNA-directed RNA polymerase specialized sigma24 family protein
MGDFEDKLLRAVIEKRTRLGLSIRALAGQIGISFSTLARLERGAGLPDNNSKIRLLEWLDDDAQELGLDFERAAFVHFRAMKNVQSSTVQALLNAADCLKEAFGKGLDNVGAPASGDESYPELSKDQLEEIAGNLRRDLNINTEDPLDSLRVNVEGVRVIKLTNCECLDARTRRRLEHEACNEWSAMSVPLDRAMTNWIVLLNDCHTVERQRVTLLEEYWHILMGHKLTKVARIAEAYGRTYDKAEEHDAYYLASASLLPREAVQNAVAKGCSAVEIAKRFGTSPDLVEYRIKRLGLWREHIGKKVELTKR